MISKMSIIERALNIKKQRKKELTELEERKKREREESNKTIERYVKGILDIFEASGKDKKTSALVWQVKLSPKNDYVYTNKLMCAVSFKDNNPAFYTAGYLGTNASSVELRYHQYLKKAMNNFNNLDVMVKNLNDIEKFFKYNLKRAFSIIRESDDTIIIMLDR